MMSDEDICALFRVPAHLIRANPGYRPEDTEQQNETDKIRSGGIVAPILKQTYGERGQIEFLITVRQLRKIMGVDPDLSDEQFMSRINGALYQHVLRSGFGER